MNIDEHPQIAGQLGIQSIPAVIAFDKGQPVDGFVGALPESQIRGFIERLVGPIQSESAVLLAEADEAAANGDAAGAAAIYAEILAEEPGEAKAIGGLAKLHVAAGRLDEAKALLETAPAAPAGKEQEPAVVAALAALRLAEQASNVGELAPLEQAIAANPDNHQARFDLAVALSAKGERDAAADQLLEIIRRDRKWNDEAARKQLLQLFEAWGLMDPASVAARRKLSAIWF
jgi:putative thioredoxin